MGKVFSVLIKKPIRNYNVENRAHKLISKDKLPPAPKYETDQDHIEKLLKEQPSKFQESLLKDAKLDDHLKKVFVVSRGDNADQNKTKKGPILLKSKPYEPPLFGIVEPDKVSQGKVTLTNALKFLTNYQADPIGYGVDLITKKYSLPKTTVSNILHYYKVFQVYMPPEKGMKAKFAGPPVSQTKVVVKSLPSSEENKK